MRHLPLVLVIASTLASTAAAHVGPSKDDNNRYLKLTPQTDRLRLAYTVFFGEVPGARTRPAIDTDRDGTISEAEAQTFGDKLAAEVAATLDLELDKVQQKVVWEQIVVGMGSPQVRAGAFSVDLVANVCSAPGATHTVILRDRFKLPNPGETEVKIEDTHGIEIAASKIGTSSDRDVKFVGPGGPLADDGVRLTFEVTDQAPPAASACTTPLARGDSKGLPTALVVGGAAVVAFALAMLVTVIRRRSAK